MRAAAVQLQSTPDRDRNLQTADRLTREAAKAGAELIVLPEKWPALGTPEQTIAAAEPLDGPVVQWATSIASELGVDLVAGSFTEHVPDDDRERNTSIHVGPDGSIQASYRKIHMFDVEVGGRVYKESEHEAPGDEIVVSRTADNVGLGMSICYDVRFPELYRALGELTLIIVPAAFTQRTGRAHWEILLRARAVENQCYVLAAAQTGEHPGGRRTFGHSMLVDLWGDIVAAQAEGEGVVVGDIDPARISDVRARLPALAHRTLR